MDFGEFKTEFNIDDKTSSTNRNDSSKNDLFNSKDINISLNLNDSQLKLPIEILNSLNESINNTINNNKVIRI